VRRLAGRRLVVRYQLDGRNLSTSLRKDVPVAIRGCMWYWPARPSHGCAVASRSKCRQSAASQASRPHYLTCQLVGLPRHPDYFRKRPSWSGGPWLRGWSSPRLVVEITDLRVGMKAIEEHGQDDSLSGRRWREYALQSEVVSGLSDLLALGGVAGAQLGVAELQSGAGGGFTEVEESGESDVVAIQAPRPGSPPGCGPAVRQGDRTRRTVVTRSSARYRVEKLPGGFQRPPWIRAPMPESG
jgi:hypothetical protein